MGPYRTVSGVGSHHWDGALLVRSERLERRTTPLLSEKHAPLFRTLKNEVHVSLDTSARGFRR